MNGLHADAKVLTAGVPLKEAKGAVVLLHGRGGSAADILSLAGPLGRSPQDDGLAYLAPQAAGSTWYPQSFLAERKLNEPWLSSALELVESVVASTELQREHVLLAGFSQGACLATEFVASRPARYAGLIAFTGGLVGPLASSVAHEGDLAGMPALFLSGDPDPHVPWGRVQESAAELERMGARVTALRYPGRPHTISQAELEHARRMVREVFGAHKGWL